MLRQKEIADLEAAKEKLPGGVAALEILPEGAFGYIVRGIQP